MKWLKKALGLKGRDRATALVTEGFVHAKEGRLDDAKRSYEDAVDADETLSVAWLNLGLARLDLFNRDAASLDVEGRKKALDRIADALERALKLDATSFVGWRALAHVEERRSSWARAEDAWKQVEATVPKDNTPPNAAALLEAKKARAALAQKAVADRARKRALAALEPAVDEAEKKAALAELLPLAEDPAVADVLVRGPALVGTLARRLGDRAVARAWLEKAVLADKSDVDALRELASVCLESGDLSRALQASMDAYRERPTDAGLVCNVGVCHLGLGDVGQAAEFIELAHRLEPKDPIVLRAKDALGKARAARP